MPVASTTLYLKSLLDGLAMPGGLENMVSYVTPPDPNTESQYPTSYVWPSEFDETRNPEFGGTIPRNTGPGTPSGFKPITHMIDIFIVYFMANDEPDSDSLFPGVVDAVMAALRTSEDPALITDPYTGMESNLYDVGEVIKGRIVVSAVEDQVFNRYDCLLVCTVHELIQA